MFESSVLNISTCEGKINQCELFNQTIFIRHFWTIKKEPYPAEKRTAYAG